MLTVKIQCGDETERTFYVNDILDVKRVQDNLLEDFQRVLAQDKSEEKITLERLIDKVGVTDEDELDSWVEEAYEVMDELHSSDYDSIDDMTEALDKMASALSDIYYTSRDFN